MSLYNSPKEHKLRKPRTGFENIKQHQFYESLSPKEEIEVQPLIKLSDRSILKVKKEKRRRLLFQVLVFCLIIVPLTWVSMNFLFNKIENSHKKLAPHHYRNLPIPPDAVYGVIWKRAYTAFANQEYRKAIFAFNFIIDNYSNTTFALTGLISTYDELCKNGDEYYCDQRYNTLMRYKNFYRLKNQDNESILKEIKTFNQYQVERILQIQNQEKTPVTNSINNSSIE